MYWKKRFDRENPNEAIENQIREIFESNDSRVGYRRIDLELREQGILVNHKKIKRIMRKLGLKCVKFTRKSRKYSSYKGTVGTVAKNLIHRRFYTSVPHQKLTTDTTEFRYYESSPSGQIVIKKLYLDPFMDMFNGEILSYRISERPNAQAIQEAQKEAIEQMKDCPYRRTFHSDQGWAYQMSSYSNALEENKIFQSMSRKGNCLDNSPMENFFGLLKQEMYHGEFFTSFDSLNQLKNI
ncbi:putative transposase InsK IS150 [Listeria monocytogenes]|nr:putative transposase InsK IS150 [Listeria monocytogenes]ARM71979.1 putative transposase InsK IS150 [Listeria monocytogenes]